MKVLITAGGTREPIDEVRVFTNISTGKLGSKISDAFCVNKKITKIFYVCSRDSIIPSFFDDKVEIRFANSVSEVYDVLKELVPEVDIVIHSMAVSDFGFKHSDVKLKSNDPDAFIESLKERIYSTPKIISFIKTWNPNVKLVGFKFEVGKSLSELVDIAYKSLLKNKCDYVVANDKKVMNKKKEHVAHIIDKEKNVELCLGKASISERLVELLVE